MRSTRRRWLWWTLAWLFVAAGVVGVVIAVSRPEVGPSLPHPVGVTSPQGLAASVPSDWALTAPVATSASGDMGGGVTANFASLDVTSHSAWPHMGLTSQERSGRVTKRAVAKFAARSIPQHLQIPNLGISVGVSILGLNKDNTVQVPTSFAIPGWYKYGPTPGERGSSVILGHVDSHTGPGVFYRLNQLRPGMPVIVTLADHVVVHFKVIGVRMYTKSNFPDKVVYGSRTYGALQLVTCGGAFDPVTGHYESNIVAYTVMTSFARPHQ